MRKFWFFWIKFNCETGTKSSKKTAKYKIIIKV